MNLNDTKTIMNVVDSNWFLFSDLRRKFLQQDTWIPLRALQDLKRERRFGEVGYLHESFNCGSLAIPIEHRELGEQLGWSEIGIGHDTRCYADEEGYKQADQYLLDGSINGPRGIELVIDQHFGWSNRIWHLNQDLILALNLRQEGDVWVSSDEGYIDVVRLLRDEEGQPVRMDIRTEQLRDYLAARRMALRIAWYRDRDSIFRSVEHIEWRENPPSRSELNYKFIARCDEMREGVGFGKGVILTVQRTDVYPDDDVPEFGPENNENTVAESRAFGREGPVVYRVEGEIWSEEWVEPANHSVRVRGDEVPSTTSFIVDASGNSMSADELDDEDIGRYLWFRPQVIPNLICRRGVNWRWYTRDTGGIEVSYGYKIHFGLNALGLINVYAYDIGKLPEWQRRIWQGFNISPEGGVSSELLDAQFRVQPADTLAPESHLAEGRQSIDDLFRARFGVPLFRSLSSEGEIIKSLHRFRALDQVGVFALAKDITRVFIESINVPELHKIAPPEKKGVGTGSLKSLERVLATIVDANKARYALGLLVGIYELRLADAHLQSSQIDEAFKLAYVEKSGPPLKQGLQMLNNVMVTIQDLYLILELKTAEG
jgi:hypothetical protein